MTTSGLGKSNITATDPLDNVDALRAALWHSYRMISKKCEDCRGNKEAAICCDDRECPLNLCGPRFIEITWRYFD